MLKVLRKKGVAKKVLWVLAVIIILAFGVFGSVYTGRDNTSNNPKYAGKIFGKKILFTDFQNQLQQTVIVDAINYGNNFNKIRHLLDQDRIQRTWVRMMLIKEAEKRNISVSDEDVIKFIQTYPPFQVSDQFNKMLYNDILKNFLRVSARDFEECLRDKLKIDKVTEQETTSISVTEEDTKQAYRQYHEKIQVSYVLFANEDFKNLVAIDDQQIKAFYETNKNLFSLPPMVNVEYLRFDFNITENKNPDEVTQEQRDAAWNKAYNVQQELKGKPDLSEIAKANDLTIHETGLFSMEQPNLKAGWPFELIQQIFSMKSGEISQLVETAQGYQILRIKELAPARMPDFEQVKASATEQWLTREASQLAKSKAEELAKTIKEIANPDFTKITKDLKLEIVQTPSFGRADSYLPKLGPSPDFMEKAFALTADKPLSEVAETAKGYCLIHLDNRNEADMIDFEKEKDKFAQAILLDKKTKSFNDFLTSLRLKANLESYLPEDKK